MQGLSILYLGASEADQVLVEAFFERSTLEISRFETVENEKSVLNHLKFNDLDLLLVDFKDSLALSQEAINLIHRSSEATCMIALGRLSPKISTADLIAWGFQDVISKQELNSQNCEHRIKLALERQKLYFKKGQIHRGLLEKEERYQELIENPKVYVLRTDLEGRYTYYNDVFARTFLHGDQNVIGEISLHHIMQDDHAKTYEIVAKCMQEPGQVFKVDLRKPGYLPGTVLKTTWEFICLCDAQGRPIEIQCQGFDLSSKLEAQHAVELSLKRQKQILNSEHELYLILNKQGMIQFVSGCFEEIFKRSVPELLDTEFRKHLDIESKQKWDKFLSLKDQKPHLNLNIPRSNDRTLKIDFTINRSPEDELILIGRDISDQFEENRREHEEVQFYQELMNHLPFGLLIENIERSSIVEINERACQLLNIDQAFHLQQNRAFSEFWSDPKQSQQFNADLELKAQLNGISCELETSPADYKEFILYARLVYLKGEFCRLISFTEANTLSASLGESKLNIPVQEIISNIPYLALILKEEAIIEYSSERSSLLGYLAEELKGKPLRDFVLLEDLPKVRQLEEILKQLHLHEKPGDLKNLSLELKTKSGVYRRVSFVLNTLNNGTKLILFGKL